ncbi:MAG TPA: hypothetical protein VGD46_14590 [Rhizobacter sp.]
MKLRTKRLLLVSLTGAALMSACGGSSDDTAGQVGSSFQVSPDEASYSTGTDFCPGLNTKIADVAIIGGTAPYRVISPNHQDITFGPAGSTAPTSQGEYVVGNRNQQFAVFATGCLEMTVTVLDDLQRVATVTVAAASGAGN